MWHCSQRHESGGKKLDFIGDKISSLTEDQETAKGMMIQMHPTFILKGYAGTGKTYLLHDFIRDAPTRNITVTAPTHKAVGVANGDCTIHSYLNLRIKEVEDKQVLMPIGFADKIMRKGTVVIDEASMISRELLHYVKEAQNAFDLKIIFVGDPCFANGTKILMYDGSIKTIENICIGDIVMGPDSGPRTVLRTCSGNTMLYKITQRHGEMYRVTPNHKIAFKRRLDNGRYPSLGDNPLISAQEAINLSDKFYETFGGYKNCVYYQKKDVEIDPYFLGFWLGDGDSNFTRLSICETEHESIEYFKKYAEEIGLICTITHIPEKHYFRLIISSGIGRGRGKGKNSLLSSIRKYNLYKNKHIPIEYFINSENIRLNLLAGLIDSDGSYSEIGGRYTIYQKNKKLRKDIKTLCDQLGFRASIYKNGTVNIYGGIERIPCKINRKISIAPKNRRDVTKIKIEEDVFDTFFGIEVDCDNLFMLPDATIVSNCQIPPVGENISPVWEIDCPTFTLKEIVRQARDSSIISLATAVRDGSAYTHGISRFVDNESVFTGGMKELTEFFYKCMNESTFPQIISYRNKIVDSSNNWARNIVMENPTEAFLVGEEVYIRSVNEEQVHKLEDIVKIVDISKPFKYDKRKVDYPMMVNKIYIQSHKGEEDLLICASDDDQKIFRANKSAAAARAKSKQKSWGEFWKLNNSISEVKHIYALTAHRSQGSTFQNVVVNCNDISSDRLLYTAVTRASDKLFLFRQ